MRMAQLCTALASAAPCYRLGSYWTPKMSLRRTPWPLLLPLPRSVPPSLLPEASRYSSPEASRRHYITRGQSLAGKSSPFPPKERSHMPASQRCIPFPPQPVHGVKSSPRHQVWSTSRATSPKPPWKTTIGGQVPGL